MKLIEYKKMPNDEIIVRFCSFSIFHKIRIGTLVKEKLLGGIFTITKEKRSKKYYILHFLILTRVRINRKKLYYCNNKLLYTKDLAPAFAKKYRDIFLPEYKNIFILNGHHGESYTASAFFAKRLMQKYENVKFVCYRECHRKMWNLFWPDIKIDLLDGYTGSDLDKCFTYKNQNFYYTFLQWDNDVENLKNGKPIPHRIDSALQNLGLTREELIKQDLSISEQDRQSFRDKLKTMNLNTDKLVILAPEADSMEHCDIEFWQKLAGGLKQREYSIYLNVLDNSFDIEGCDKTFLTHAEVLQLAELSKGAIMLRSGFSELISYLDKPLHVIYTSFWPWCLDKDKNRKINDIMFEANLISKYPFRNPDITYEYKYYDYTQDELVNKILAKF